MKLYIKSRIEYQKTGIFKGTRRNIPAYVVEATISMRNCARSTALNYLDKLSDKKYNVLHNLILDDGVTYPHDLSDHWNQPSQLPPLQAPDEADLWLDVRIGDKFIVRVKRTSITQHGGLWSICTDTGIELSVRAPWRYSYQAV